MASQRSLLSVSGPAVYKQRAIQEAEQQQKVIDEKLKRSGDPPSKYQFRELIGKGAYGRVYKRYAIGRSFLHIVPSLHYITGCPVKSSRYPEPLQDRSY